MKKYDESFKTEQIKNDSSVLMGNPFVAIIKSHNQIQHSVMILIYSHTQTHSRIYFVYKYRSWMKVTLKINYYVKDD